MATTSLLDTIPPQVLHTLNQLTAQSTSTMTDHQSGLLRAVKELVQAHPRATASAVVIGFVVMCNPLAMIGFGRKGPGSDSFAASWQSRMGNVPAGSSFAILQGFGMKCAVGIVIIGAIIAGGPVIVAAAREIILPRVAAAARMIASAIKGVDLTKVTHVIGEHLNEATQHVGKHLIKVIQHAGLGEHLDKVTQHAGEHLNEATQHVGKHLIKVAQHAGEHLNKATQHAGLGEHLDKVTQHAGEHLNKVTQRAGEHLAMAAHDNQALASVIEEVKKWRWPW